MLRYLGYRWQDIDSALSAMIDECIAEIEDTAQPKYCTRRLDIVDIRFEGKDIAARLTGCPSCILMAATLGVETDRLIQRYAVRDINRSLLLDAAASSLIESVCDNIQAQLNTEHDTKQRFSPGYGDFPLSFQPHLLRLVGAEKIGLYCNESFLLLPRKSVTAVVGIKTI